MMNMTAEQFIEESIVCYQEGDSVTLEDVVNADFDEETISSAVIGMLSCDPSGYCCSNSETKNKVLEIVKKAMQNKKDYSDCEIEAMEYVLSC